MKNIITILLLLCTSLIYSQATLTGTNLVFDITNSNDFSSPFTVSGTVFHTTTEFSGLDIQVGDLVYFQDGPTTYSLPISTIIVQNYSYVELVLTDISATVTQVPTGRSAIVSATDPNLLATPPDGIPEDLKAGILNDLRYRIQIATNNAEEITDYVGTLDVPPAVSPSSYTGETWRNSVGQLYYSDGTSWLTDKEVLFSTTPLQGQPSNRYKIGIDTLGIDTIYISNNGTFRRFQSGQTYTEGYGINIINPYVIEVDTTQIVTQNDLTTYEPYIYAEYPIGGTGQSLTPLKLADGTNNGNILFWNTSGPSWTISTGSAPSLNQALVWNGVQWVPGDVAGKVDTFRVNGPNLELSLQNDGVPVNTVPIASIAPIQNLTAGTGISITGTTNLTITNTGDLSNTNEIQLVDTFRVNGANLELSLSQDGQGVRLVPLSQIISGGGGIYGTIATGQVAFGSATNTIQGTSNFNYNGTLLNVPSINIPTTTNTTSGIIFQNNARLLHTFGTANLFLAAPSANLTLTGTRNTVINSNGFANATTAQYNTAMGENSLRDITTGSFNFALGPNTLMSNQTQNQNFALGVGVLQFLTSGSNNTGIGVRPLDALTNGGSNTAIGIDALGALTSASNNTAIGSTSLFSNQTGGGNVGIGVASLYSMVSGTANIGIGDNAGYTLSGNSQNIFIGVSSGYNSSNVGRNVMIGAEAGFNNTSGSHNVFLGYRAGFSETTNSNRLYIENTESSIPLIGGDFTNDRVGINVPVSSITSTLHVRGINSLSGNSSLLVENAAQSPILFVRNDGEVQIGNNNVRYIPGNNMLSIPSATGRLRVGTEVLNMQGLYPVPAAIIYGSSDRAGLVISDNTDQLVRGSALMVNGTYGASRDRIISINSVGTPVVSKSTGSGFGVVIEGPGGGFYRQPQTVTNGTVTDIRLGTWMHNYWQNTGASLVANGEYTNYGSTGQLATDNITVANFSDYRTENIVGGTINTRVITNRYNIHISSTQSTIAGQGVTNNWGIFQTDANTRNYFNGFVGLATTSPTRSLDVNGEVAIRDLTTTTATVAVGADANGVLSSVPFSTIVTSGGGLTGNGITNYVTQYNSTTTVDTTGIIWVGGRMGVGTTSPTHLGHFNGPFRATTIISNAINSVTDADNLFIGQFTRTGVTGGKNIYYAGGGNTAGAAHSFVGSSLNTNMTATVECLSPLATKPSLIVSGTTSQSTHVFEVLTNSRQTVIDEFGRIGVNRVNPIHGVDINGGLRVDTLSTSPSSIAGWTSGNVAANIVVGSGLSLTGNTLNATASVTVQRAFIEGSTATTIDLDANTGVVKDVNGNNVAFTLPTSLDAFDVYKNGILLSRTGTLTTRDYSVNVGTNEITFVTALLSTDRIVIRKQ